MKRPKNFFTAHNGQNFRNTGHFHDFSSVVETPSRNTGRMASLIRYNVNLVRQF